MSANQSQVLPSHFTGTTGGGNPELAVPARIDSTSSLNEILVFARKERASDVHLGAGKPVIFRQFGRLITIIRDTLSADGINRLLREALPKNIQEKLDSSGDAEYVHTVKGYGRFRMAIMKQRHGWDLTARLVPTEIPQFETSGMPAACANLTKWAQGLVLITGPAGCGKTTALATLVELVNQNRHDHIITIEAPIEIVYEPKQCQVTQREISLHTLSQDNALRAALREDPDILVVSELRDLSTIQLAVSAAETGHLVFGTMNTNNAAQTISSVIDSFPAEEQPIIRNMISESLRGVICQQLVPKKDASGMAAAYEVLIVIPSVSNLIRSNKIGQINNSMVTGKNMGMMLMDNSLEALARAGTIANKEAIERSSNPAAMKQLLGGSSIAKSKFAEIGPQGAAILIDMLQFGVLEEFSPTQVRTKANAPLDENFIRKIAKDQFDTVWKILNDG